MEDDIISASALRSILTKRGFDIVHVTTVAQGLARLADKPEFVVLDLMLPDGDGLAVLQAIRNNGLSTRVVVTTAVSDPARLQRVRASRPDLILQKPIDLSVLLGSLHPLN